MSNGMDATHGVLHFVRAMSVTIQPLDDTLAPHFSRLNRAWIERLFVIEPADELILAEPRQLVAAGGAVLFALVGDEVVGTGGLQVLDTRTVELVKMAVDPAYQGRGIGAQLLAALVAHARAAGFAQVYIETSSALPASNGLYRKFGFKTTGQTVSRHGYARADVFYELDLGEGGPET